MSRGVCNLNTRNSELIGMTVFDKKVQCNLKCIWCLGVFFNDSGIISSICFLDGHIGISPSEKNMKLIQVKRYLDTVDLVGSIKQPADVT